MTNTDLPRIRLLPKTDPRPVRRGVPWMYANQVVMDRRTKALAPGSLAVLQNADRDDLALVTVNPASKIAVRILDHDPKAIVDADWLRTRIARALALRERLYPEPFYRLIHAEADGFPGLIVDRFGEAAVIQPNAAWAERLLDPLVESLCDATGVTTVVKNAGGRARKLEGLDDAGGLLRGTLAGPMPVPMNGATYLADLTEGQKTGLFYDQRDNHALAARLAKGGRVLDVFSHVGGFALAALAGGATSALAVDGSAAALALAEDGAKASGVSDRFETRKGDAFATMTALAEEGQTFDMVICDPPAFAPSKDALEAGLRAYEKTAMLGAALVAPDGYLVLCSCSHAADLTRFRQASLRGLGRARRRAQIIATGGAGPDHPQHSHLAESGYLKALFLRLTP